MNIEQFNERVRKLERSASANPGLYRVRVIAFSLMGYVLYAALAVAALGMLFGMGALALLKPGIWLLKFGWKLALVVLGFVGALAKSLVVTTEPPSGVPLRREDAPKLFTELDALRQRLAVAPFEQVLLTDELNAGVLQLPRFGLFGSRSYLMLGMPLLQSLSEEDMRSVLAHELGHLSRNHSRTSAWVYRVVRSYVQLIEHTGGNAMIERFLDWYVPKLQSLSFPLRRQNEYEADAASRDVVGAERAAQALANINVRGAISGNFWRQVHESVADVAHPPAHLFTEWRKRIPEQPTDDAEKALRRALAEETEGLDTHPSLRRRIEALGAQVHVEPMPAVSAAEAYFESRYENFVQQAGYLWSSKVNEGWKDQHHQLQKARARVAELGNLMTQRELTVPEAFELADLGEDGYPNVDALPAFRAVLGRDPAHLGARYAVARILLSRDDAEGVPLMRALQKERDEQLRAAATILLQRYEARQRER